MKKVKVFSQISYPIGTILFDEDSKETFKVKKVHSMLLMTSGEKDGYGLELEKVEILGETNAN